LPFYFPLFIIQLINDDGGGDGDDDTRCYDAHNGNLRSDILHSHLQVPM